MRTMAICICACLWALVLLGGFLSLQKYERTPGNAADSPRQWPPNSKVTRTPGVFTLVMAAHPRCPCTRVSIEELQQVLERGTTPVEVRILFFKPAGANWTPTVLWRQADALPGVRAAWDEDGIEAARFGAHTSGHVLLFDGDGNLLFSGGVTSGRGHKGPSEGNAALAAWLTPGGTGKSEALVFGCPLTKPLVFRPGSTGPEENCSLCTKGN